MLDGHHSKNVSSAILSMNLNSSSPKMKRSSTGRGGSGRAKNKPAQNSGPLQGQVYDGLYQNERLVCTLTSLLGCNVLVTEKSGKQFEGVFKTISPEGTIVLGKACQVEEQRQNGVVGSSLPLSDLFEHFVIQRKNWVTVVCKDVDLEECHLKKDAFKTDNAIIKKVNGQPSPKKELEKWVPSVGADGTLETPPLHSTMANGWSAEQMFNVNEKKYGVKSTYNEDMEEYTTKLDKMDTPEYREKEKFAAQKADEIIKESPFERGTTDTGRSEEQLYSSVVRKYERSTPQNWRNPHQDRPEREQRSQKVPPLGSSSPSAVKQEPLKSVQVVDEVPKIQVKEKVIKPVTEIAVESKTEIKVEACSDVVKDAKSPQTLSPAKAQVSTIKPPVNQTSPKVSPEAPKDPPVVSRTKEVADFKSFSTNFQLKSKESGQKVKKSGEEEEKVTSEKKKEEKEKESQAPPQETKTEVESAGAEKSSLNPFAQEFHPGPIKRNSPSPRSNSTPSSSGAPSPFQPQPHFPPSLYPPNGIYSRNGPRGRGLRPEFIEHANYVNASNAAGQPFFTQPVPQFVNQGNPSGMQFIQPVRHHGLQHPVFIQHGQAHMMMQMGQMGPGPYQDGTLYYGHGHPIQMIQSPQLTTPPSMQQPQFNFSPSSIPHQTVNAVRPVSQAVMSQQPQQANILLVRQPNDIPPTQIINRQTQAPTYPGN